MTVDPAQLTHVIQMVAKAAAMEDTTLPRAMHIQLRVHRVLDEADLPYTVRVTKLAKGWKLDLCQP